jgi:catechol 2,3-dioxygenase-like lactoylglutathione lyase family enzyme
MKHQIKFALFIAIGLLSITSAFAQHNDSTGFNMPALNPKSKLADISGNHIGIRVSNYDTAIKWWTEKMDFRIIHQWPYADEKLAYLAPPNENSFWVEILAEGKLKPQKNYTDLGESLSEAGYHHICMHVKNLAATLAELKKRGVTTVGEPFYLESIKRKLAFIADPWGNLIELSEVVFK